MGACYTIENEREAYIWHIKTKKSGDIVVTIDCIIGLYDELLIRRRDPQFVDLHNKLKIGAFNIKYDRPVVSKSGIIFLGDERPIITDISPCASHTAQVTIVNMINIDDTHDEILIAEKSKRRYLVQKGANLSAGKYDIAYEKFDRDKLYLITSYQLC